MTQNNPAAGFAPRLALLVAALLLALAAIIASASIASAQQSGNNGQQSGASGPTPSLPGGGDDDDQSGSGDGAGPTAADSPQCLQFSGETLQDFQNRYHARSAKDGGPDGRLAAIPQADRLTSDALACAQLLQNEAYPGLTWAERTVCTLYRLISLRQTGDREERADGTYALFHRTATFECRYTPTPVLDDGSTPPDDLIPPSPPRVEITPPISAYYWICWEDCT